MNRERDPAARWRLFIPRDRHLSLATAVDDACRVAFQRTRQAHSRFPLAYPLGQNRYYAIQEALLEFGETDPVFEARLEHHPNGSTTFVALLAPRDDPKIRLIASQIESQEADPQPRLFLEVEQDRQIQFFEGIELSVGVLAYGFSRAAPEITTFQRVLFPDGSDSYLQDFIDIGASRRLREAPPTEEIPGSDTPPRSEEKDDDASQDEGA